MRTLKSVLVPATLIAAAALNGHARAAVADISFFGPGVSGALHLTYGPGTDSKYPGQGFEVTGISGSFSDSNNGLDLVNAPVSGLVPISPTSPDLSNELAPHDFSRFGPITGLPADSNDVITYDNLYWPDGSPQTATDYAAAGGVLDIYGLMFRISGGDVVDLWSNGTFVPGTYFDYGVAVANSGTALDYVGGDVSVPEPASLSLLGVGLLGLLVRRYRTA